MPSRYDVIPATREAVLEIAQNLRDEDVDEVKAYDEGQDPHDALMRNFDLSTHTWVGTIDGQPACIFGVYAPNYFSTVAHPWFRGSDRMEGHSLAFLRRCKTVLAGLQAQYETLANVVDASNTKAIQWLEWMGFTVDEDLTYLVGSPTAFRRYRIRSVK
jgi:hypothetical protein